MPVATLAQLAFGDPEAVRPLPPAPALERLLLENPWPVVGLAVFAAIVAFVVLNNRGRGRQALLAAGALLALAAASWTIARLVTTDRERLTAATAALVDAAARVDIPALERTLDADVRLETSLRVAQIPLASGRDALLARVRESLGGTYAVKEHAILETQAAIDGPGVARTQTRVRATWQASGIPAFSWWRIDWRRQPDGSWHATILEPLAIWWPQIGQTPQRPPEP